MSYGNEKKLNGYLPVVMQNELARAKYSMELNERRLLYVAMSKINQHDTDFQTVTFSISEYINLLEKSMNDKKQQKGGKTYELIKEGCRNLLKRLVAFRERQMQRLTDEQKSRVPQNINYIPQGNEVKFAVAAMLYDTWAPPLLMGPKGSGKSTLAEALAEILYLPLRKISGGIDVNADYLLGCKTLAPVETAPTQLIAKVGVACARAGIPLTAEEIKQLSGGQAQMRVVHEPGVLLEAVTKGEMILIDEINVLIPEVTSLLHTLLDWQRTITVPGIGEVKAHPDFRLVAAMNVGYMGTRPLNSAFRDRFRGIQVQGISKETLLELLQEKASEATAKKLADIYQTLYESVYSPTGATLTENCISLRAILRAAEEISMGIAPEKDIIISCLTEGLESESERTQVRDLVEMRL